MVSATKPGVTTFTTPNDNEIVVSRVFDAPRALVFATFTEPKHLRRWMLGPDGWTMRVCELDLRAGGSWRYVWRKDDGTEMAMSGTVREVAPPERLVTTERWGPEWPETVNTLVLTERGGRTTMTQTIVYPSKEARDAALASGMKQGIELSFARLDRLVAAPV